MRFVYHTAKILSVMTKQYVCIFLVCFTSAHLGMRLWGREDSVFHSLPPCLFFPRFQILVLFNRGGGGGGGLPIGALFFQKGKRTRRGNKTWLLFFVSFPIRRLPAGWIFNLVPRVLSDRNPKSKKGQLLILLCSYSRTFTNRHHSTTTTFFCPQGGHCGEVQM